MSSSSEHGVCNVCGREAKATIRLRYNGGSRVEIKTCGEHPLVAHFLWLARPAEGLKMEAPFVELPRVGVVGDRVTKEAMTGSLAIVACEDEDCPRNFHCVCSNTPRVSGVSSCFDRPMLQRESAPIDV